MSGEFVWMRFVVDGLPRCVEFCGKENPEFGPQTPEREWAHYITTDGVRIVLRKSCIIAVAIADSHEDVDYIRAPRES